MHEKFNQMAIQPKIGFDFASALRHILGRIDVIMVGEIRDPETAQSAVQAALTGHLVFSTLHTNDSASAVTRLLDLGVYPFLLRLGSYRSHRPAPGAEKFAPTAAWTTTSPRSRFSACASRERTIGSSRCSGVRAPSAAEGQAIEVAAGSLRRAVTGRIQKLVSEERPIQEIKREALNDGMLTLREYAIKKLGRGETSYEEVLAITDEAKGL